jgi:hypothetical protein
LSVRLSSAVLAAAICLAISGCSAAPEPKPTGSAPAVDSSEQSTINGEWTLTRTVTESDDAGNPAHAVAAVSTRAVLFGDVECAGGPCTGTVKSGPTTAVRDTGTFSSSGDVIRYEFSGFLNCLRQDTGAVLVVNGYAYTAAVELTVIATDAEDESKASTLEGTLTYTDALTPEAIEAGCTRTPLESTTEYALTAVRAADAAAVATP